MSRRSAPDAVEQQVGGAAPQGRSGAWDATGVMRVATFNVRHGRPERARRPDHARLVAAVVSLDAEVIGIQELDRGTSRVGGVDQPTMLADATGMDVRFGRAIDHDGGHYGVALASRRPLGSTEVLRLPGAGEPRVAIMGILEGVDELEGGSSAVEPAVSGRGVSWAVGCTHLTTVADDAIGQLGVVLEALTDLAGDRPAVLLGDLNLEADRVGPVLASHGWIAARSGPTHPAARPTRRIDWVLVRAAFVESSSVLDLRASDHRPLVADVRPRDSTTA